MKRNILTISPFLSMLMIVFHLSTARGQDLEKFTADQKNIPSFSTTAHFEQFNGYTNHWHDYYTTWHRYGNLFKMGAPEIQHTIYQTKVDVAEDMNIPGLLMEEGFLSDLLKMEYSRLDHPTENEVVDALKKGAVLVVTNPLTSLGKQLEKQGEPVFEWTINLNSHQFGSPGYVPVKAFHLKNGNDRLYVLSSTSTEQVERFLKLVDNTRTILQKYNLFKGWFGVGSLLNSVTCAPGHPLELIGKGMNEGCSWFVFNGYMDFLSQKQIKNWVEEVNLPVYTDVGFSPIYGCMDYETLQVQDMATNTAWYDFAKKKQGYVFKPVYDPLWDGFQFDGYIAKEGNKEQIDQEDVPFINSTGALPDDLTSSMVLFIEKGKALTRENIWDAILHRREVAVEKKALMMGPAEYRNALQILYLDKYYLENYFGDQVGMEATVEGYDLLVTLTNGQTGPLSGKLVVHTSSKIKVPLNQESNLTIPAGSQKQIRINLQPELSAMGSTNPVAVSFKGGNHEKTTLTMLDLPVAVSIHQLLYGHAPEVSFPVTIHNYTDQKSFPVKVQVFRSDQPRKPVYEESKTGSTAKTTYQEVVFPLKLDPGNYFVHTTALGATSVSQLGIGKATGKAYLYELDLNSDGVNEYRMENDSVQITLLTTGARVIEYIVKSRNDNVLFKLWPKKAIDDKREFRKKGYYPYGGFEDFLGQASMETHKVYDARIIRKEGDYVQLEMTADYFGNTIKKTFTLFGNAPLLEVRFALNFKNPEANMLGPQPITELGLTHGTEDIFTANTLNGIEQFRMRPEDY